MMMEILFLSSTECQFWQDNNYADNFGFQWNKFQKTQINRETRNSTFSRERFFAATNWDKENLAGKYVLEAGSGTGRFTQIVLDYTKARLYILDYSDAVSANYKNNSHNSNWLKLFQASIYDIPFRIIHLIKYFVSVLQQTPDFKKSVQSLVSRAKPGSEIVIDFYSINGWYTRISARYMLQPFTKKLSHEKLLRKIEKNADRLIKTYYFFDKLKAGMIVHFFLPMCDINRTWPANLSKETLREWVILDTFDMFSPGYDNPQRVKTVPKWMEQSSVAISFSGFVTYANNLRMAVVWGIKK